MSTGQSFSRRALARRRNRVSIDRGERGQVALPMLLLTLSVVVAASGTIFLLGRVLVDRSAAQAAADAAALAAAADGPEAAAAIALSNGAQLVRVTESGTAVVVEVTLGWGSARARAGRIGPP